MNRNEIGGSEDEHDVRWHRLHHVADFLEANDLFLQILLLLLQYYHKNNGKINKFNGKIN